ncbi:MAG TPA: hypothetical protein VGF46_00505, partial [Gaiellales bacterium]
LALTAPLAAAGLLPAQTTLVHFRAFDASGKVVGLQVGATVHGNCFFGSIGLPRPDAWRCTVGNEIYDPCLESPKGPAAPLICVSGKRGIPLRVQVPLPVKLGNRPEAHFFAWRLVLSNGDVCQRFTGTAAGIVQGQGLVYGCASGGITTEPSSARPLWTVRYLAKGVDPRHVERLAELHVMRVATALG